MRTGLELVDRQRCSSTVGHLEATIAISLLNIVLTQQLLVRLPALANLQVLFFRTSSLHLTGVCIPSSLHRLGLLANWPPSYAFPMYIGKYIQRVMIFFYLGTPLLELPHYEKASESVTTWSHFVKKPFET